MRAARDYSESSMRIPRRTALVNFKDKTSFGKLQRALMYQIVCVLRHNNSPERLSVCEPSPAHALAQ
jgi:hypothetical protein